MFIHICTLMYPNSFELSMRKIAHKILKMAPSIKMKHSQADIRDSI